MNSQPREPESTKVTEVLNRGEGRFDLSDPPSRDEVGMSAGRTNVTYQRPDHKTFRVVVVLPMGKQIDVDARLVTFDSLAGINPQSAPPTTMDIHYYPATLEEGRDHLLSAATQFGFDAKSIGDWYDEANNGRQAKTTDAIRTRWLGAVAGYLRIDLQGTYKAPVDTPESDQTLVHYLLTWGGTANALVTVKGW